MNLILYHGTDCEFDKIELNRSMDKRDFGKGFYTTTIPVQAENWAKNKKLRSGSDSAFVYVFEAEITDDLSVKKFSGLEKEWLETVKVNRVYGGIQHSYDIVIGAVANDNTMLTVSRYIQGIYTADEAIERLKYFTVNDQVSFHTEKALKYLKMIRRYEVE